MTSLSRWQGAHKIPTKSSALKDSPCHDALFSPVTRYGRSQVCYRERIFVKSLSRLLFRCFNLSSNHGRMVKPRCCVPPVGPCSALGHGNEQEHGQAGPLQLLDRWQPHGKTHFCWSCHGGSERQGHHGEPATELAAWQGHPSWGTEGEKADDW